MIDVVVVLIVLVILGAAIAYIVRSKKKGAKCIGCPAADSCCSSHKNQKKSCGCGCSEDEK